MISISPPVLPSDPTLSNPFISFDGGFTPWEFPDHLFPPFDPSPKPGDSNSGSDAFQFSKPVISSSGSEEPNPNLDQNSTNPGQDEPNQEVSVVDERKRRRMISNRESARRSRMRKQKHLENLRNQVNRLRMENRELTNRLRFVLNHSHRVRTENDRLQYEHSILRQKLLDIRQILIFRQLQQLPPAWPYNSTVISEQTLPLIT